MKATKTQKEKTKEHKEEKADNFFMSLTLSK
jgi:hypothetical protein